MLNNVKEGGGDKYATGLAKCNRPGGILSGAPILAEAVPGPIGASIWYIRKIRDKGKERS